MSKVGTRGRQGLWWALAASAWATFAVHVPAKAASPTSVTLAGSLQTELGCPGDWSPECVLTHLVANTNDRVWRGNFSLPAGNFEYKVALDNAWTESYPAGNIALGLPAASPVKFYFDENTRWVTDNLNSRIVVAAGNFQSEIGCASDWAPGCLRSWLQDADGDGIYRFGTTVLPRGSYETLAAVDEGWTESYGAGGVPGGGNIAFTVGKSSVPVDFTFVSATNALSVAVGTLPTMVIAAGSFQSELGCTGDWDPACLSARLLDADGDGIYTFGTSALPAGSYETKVALNKSWDENYGLGGVPNGPNVPFTVGTGFEPVTFSYDSPTNILTVQVGTPPIPEPATAVLTMIGLLGVAAVARRTRVSSTG